MSGLRLKPFALRRWAGLALVKQATISQITGYTQAMVSRWTAGTARIRRKDLDRIISHINQRLAADGLRQRVSARDLCQDDPDSLTPDQRRQASYARERRRLGLEREETLDLPCHSGPRRPGRPVTYHEHQRRLS